MKLASILIGYFIAVPVSLVCGQGSQNETFIDSEIAQIPACGVSKDSFMSEAISNSSSRLTASFGQRLPWAAPFSILHANV
jgi:hypothetical protein